MVKAKESYVIQHPAKKPSGEEDKQMMTITLGRRLNKTNLGEPAKFLGALAQVEGIDNLQPLGTYTFQIVLANTFDFDEVITEIRQFLDTALSAVIVPLKNVSKIEV